MPCRTWQPKKLDCVHILIWRSVFVYICAWLVRWLQCSKLTDPLTFASWTFLLSIHPTSPLQRTHTVTNDMNSNKMNSNNKNWKPHQPTHVHTHRRTHHTQRLKQTDRQTNKQASKHTHTWHTQCRHPFSFLVAQKQKIMYLQSLCHAGKLAGNLASLRKPPILSRVKVSDTSIRASHTNGLVAQSYEVPISYLRLLQLSDVSCRTRTYPDYSGKWCFRRNRIDAAQKS